MDTLDSHSQVVAYGELLRRGADGPPDYGGDDVPYFQEYLAGRGGRVRIESVERLVYLRSVFRDRPGVRAAGFKLMYGQVRQSPGVLQFLALRRVRAVHLVRANLLDAVISYEVAKKTGVFHPHRGEFVPLAMVPLDGSGLRRRLEHMEWAVARARIWLERFRLPRVEVAYEELVGRRDETFEQVLRFLGADTRLDALDSSLIRATGQSSLELVENRDEVRAALTGTRFEWMLGQAAR
jgi:hypothetical protein